jgi:uncharacterized protein (TIGR00661 family)
MKVLYAIQGTGNGHLSRAIEVVPALQNRVQVDVLISGIQGDIELPFPVKHQYQGLSFIFGKKGGIDYKQTFLKNSLFKFISEVTKCPVKEYDLIINDFEPVSAWAARFRGVTCISLSHQSAILSPHVPKPEFKDRLGMFILNHYAPAIQKFGFHFQPYSDNIFLPIIRKNIRYAKRKQKDYYVVYLPAYSDEAIIEVLGNIKDVEWKVFSKHTLKPYTQKNFSVKPIETKAFEKNLVRCKGILCGAGFETPAEALYLKKKLMVIPMKGQYEQHLNAAALKSMKVPVLPALKKEYLPSITTWIASDKVIEATYPDNTQNVIDNVLSKYIIATELGNSLAEEF